LIDVIQKDHNSAECFFNLGQLFENGLGVDRDYTSAFRYYK